MVVPCQVPPLIVPTLVRLELVMPAPSVVELRTLVPLMKKLLPVSRFKCSLDVQASVASTQLKVLSVVPFSVMPPPSAPASVGTPLTAPSSIFLSSTLTVVLLTVVVVPLTVKSPPMVTAPVVEKPSMVAPVSASVPVTVFVPEIVWLAVRLTKAPRPAMAGMVVASPLPLSPLP